MRNVVYKVIVLMQWKLISIFNYRDQIDEVVKLVIIGIIDFVFPFVIYAFLLLDTKWKPRKTETYHCRNSRL